MLYAIGAGSQVKAVDSYSDYPKNGPTHEARRRCTPNVEAIVAVQDPTWSWSPATRTGLTAHWPSFGIPVLSFRRRPRCAEAYQQFDELGEATGHVPGRKAEVAQDEGPDRADRERSAQVQAGQTYYFELDQTYYSETSSTFIGQVLGLLGMKNIADAATSAASSGGYPQLSAEFIMKSNPDYIFLADTICCGQNAEHVAARAGWSTVKAVKEGQVVGLNDDIASRWGPRIVDLLQTVADGVEEASRRTREHDPAPTHEVAPAPGEARGGRDLRCCAPCRRVGPVVVAFGVLIGAVLLGVSVGPADFRSGPLCGVMLSHVPLMHFHSRVNRIDADILWQIRLPRVVLGGMVGAMLAGGGAAYQGVFRNPLADPYLLGVAAGAGLGATIVIVAGLGSDSELLPFAAFAGAVGAVTLTYLVGATVGRRESTASIVLAGVAVAALLTAIQTYLQQQHEPDLQSVYAWILGSLGGDVVRRDADPSLRRPQRHRAPGPSTAARCAAGRRGGGRRLGVQPPGCASPSWRPPPWARPPRCRSAA